MAIHATSTPSLHLCPSLPPPPPPFPDYGGHHFSSNPASSVHTFSSVFSSICSQRMATGPGSPFLLRGGSARLHRSRSCDAVNGRRTERRWTLGRVYSASLVKLVGDEDDEELVRETRESEFKPPPEQREQLKDEEGPRESQVVRCSRSTDCTWSSSLQSTSSVVALFRNHRRAVEPPWLPVRPEPPEWVDHLMVMNADRTHIPLSLRIIKEKKKKKGKACDGGIREASDSACRSVNNAFSSMVFIVREVQTHAIRLQELLIDEDLQGIMESVHGEMNSSFVWLFQKVFFCTPTLMVSLMLLLANFTVYSMGNGTATTTTTSVCPPGQTAVATADEEHQNRRAGSSRSIAKTISAGQTASIGGSGDGGGETRLEVGAMDDGRSEEFRSSRRTVLPDGNVPECIIGEEEEVGVIEDVCSSSAREEQEEARLWQDMVNEAYRMRARVTDESLLDAETLRRMVSPVTAEIEPEDYTGEYSRTELMYQQALSQDPDNVLLLSNFAQFIHLVLHDDERAEHYFKRAVVIRPADSEALSQYASFLWLGKKDLAAAEETYLDAIAADPGNTAHAASYAHFLWSTGGEDTCYPLDADDT